MLSLSLNDDYLEIKTESKLSSTLYKDFISFMKSIHGAYYIEDKYTWMMPKKYVDDYAKKFEDFTAWKHTIEEIKGVSEVILPEFPLITDYEDFKLPPFEFQQQGISFLAHVGSGIIGDEMGLGRVLNMN